MSSHNYVEESRGLDQHGINFIDSHLKFENLSLLQGCDVAIDAHYFTARLMPHFVHPFRTVAASYVGTSSMDEENLLTVLGGAPATLLAALRREIARLEEFSIRPIFVFPGLTPRTMTPGGTQSVVRLDIFSSTAKQRDTIWKGIEEENKPSSEHYMAFSGIPHPHLLKEQGMSYIFRALKQEGYECIRAPYSSVAQIAYFLKIRLVHHAFAPPELLLYESAQSVFIDFYQKNQFCYVNRNDMLVALSLNHASQFQHFLNTMLLCACIQPSTTSSSLDAVRDTHRLLMESNVSVIEAIGKRFRTAEDVNMRTKIYQRCYALFSHALILNQHGRCVPISERESESDPILKIPCNLSELFGYRLADVLYFLHSTGVLSTSLMTDLAQNCFREHAPITDSLEYREMLERTVPLRTQIIYQVLHAMDPEGRSLLNRRTRVTWYRWSHMRETTVLWPPQINLSEWAVYNHPGPVDFTLIYEYVNTSTKELPAPYANSVDVMVAVRMKTLDLLGYFTHSMLHTMEETSGYSIYSEALRCLTAPWLEAGILFIELLRTRSLHGGECYTVPPGPTTNNNPIRIPCGNSLQNIIARMWCLVTVEFKPKATWKSGASRDLSAFLSIACAVQRMLRNLSEALCANLFLMKAVKIDAVNDKNLLVMSHMVPFLYEPTAHMGIIAQYILSVNESDLTLANIASQFPACANLERDLIKAFQFWAELQQLLAVLEHHEKEINGSASCSELVQLFRNADVLLQRKRTILFPERE